MRLPESWKAIPWILLPLWKLRPVLLLKYAIVKIVWLLRSLLWCVERSSSILVCVKYISNVWLTGWNPSLGRIHNAKKRKISSEADKQTSDVSFWPRYERWQACDIGFWASQDEEWFQSKLELFRNGTYEVRNATQWKKWCHTRSSSKKYDVSTHILAASEKAFSQQSFHC